MYLTQSTQAFYENLPVSADFDVMADPARYIPLPDDWYVGVADIVGSTHEIARGRYKAVNMVGAAVISAQLNAAKQARLPYVFGGDGAGFAVWPAQKGAAEKALDAVRRWARSEFAIELRVAMVPVRDIRAAGRDVRVARYAPTESVDFAMFSGGGLAWAETLMKTGRLGLREDVHGEEAPDLSGLSCRWSNMQARNGAILSVVLKPSNGVSENDFAIVARDVIGAAEKTEREGHPVPRNGPEIRYPPVGLALEAQAQHGARPVWLQKLVLLAQNLMIWGLFRSNTRVGRFKPSQYRSSIAPHADFRKFDDGLKMTLDCDTATQGRIEAVLRDAADKGIIRYGLHAQDEAMMTCFVPSAVDEAHMHFVDGAAGGYARAAAKLQG
ncbi:DUF3095 domain-containing protein [Shimia abyssi]|uniref:DUF3095 family protein n=1 Tax=Shimia abyssi TaxID=1662395 RepID=A0A2P8FKU7_9RHOB|nr:DUF3095 domain-containing protein [Shimia abyssi]PSL22319.1 Protein of unknown function (DUF3095) [Shimia abyssi]